MACCVSYVTVFLTLLDIVIKYFGQVYVITRHHVIDMFHLSPQAVRLAYTNVNPSGFNKSQLIVHWGKMQTTLYRRMRVT